jgi:predicted dehydrogenase
MGSKVTSSGSFSSLPIANVISAHLPYLLKSPHYEITALCNTSVKSAEIAIKRHGLPPSIKAYGDPEDIAKDPNVDLVVCCVRVDRHHQLMMPSLKAGKAAFVEWPLASNLQQAEEMLAAAQKSGSKTIMGLQSRASPTIQKIKNLVETKVIGEVLSSNLTFAIDMPGDSHPTALDYTAEKKVGGNMFTVFGGHLIDSVLYVLGGLDHLSAQLSTRWPDVKSLNADGSLNKMIKRETPDHVMLQGTLKNSAAPLSITIRVGKSYPNTPGLTWHILGMKGEIRVTSYAALSLGIPGEKIEVFDHEKDTVEAVDVEYAKEVRELPMFANNVGGLYEMYAKGETVVGFEEAVAMHKVLDKMEKSSEGKTWEKVGN